MREVVQLEERLLDLKKEIEAAREQETILRLEMNNLESARKDIEDEIRGYGIEPDQLEEELEKLKDDMARHLSEARAALDGVEEYMKE